MAVRVGYPPQKIERSDNRRLILVPIDNTTVVAVARNRELPTEKPASLPSQPPRPWGQTYPARPSTRRNPPKAPPRPRIASVRPLLKQVLERAKPRAAYTELSQRIAAKLSPMSSYPGQLNSGHAPIGEFTECGAGYIVQRVRPAGTRKPFCQVVNLCGTDDRQRLRLSVSVHW